MTGDHLGDWVFHLQTCVHLHEVEFVISGVKDEFDGTCVNITDSLGSFDCGLTDLCADLLSDLRRCLLDDLLMAALDGAVAFVKVYIVTMTISEHLKFDVTRFLYVSLYDHVLVVETLEGFSFCGI